MLFRQITDSKLAQHAYLIGCQKTGEALIADPERDVDRYVEIAEEEGLRLTAVLETHIHADFLSGARELADRHGARVYLSGETPEEWRYTWADEGYDVRLLEDEDAFDVGQVSFKAVHTPGHTPEHLSILVTDCGGGATEPMGLISGDFVFVGATGRPDLLEVAAGQEGAMEEGAAALYDSVQQFLRLPDYLQVWPGHGAGSACGKAQGSVPETTVGYERRFSPAMDAARKSQEAFSDYVLEGQSEPPLYFARMKRLNRDGPPLLGERPRPDRLAPSDLERLSGNQELTILDTRADRSAFMAGHLDGAIYTPFDETFPTIAGSYADPDQPIYLIIEADQLEDAVRNLVRIGLDDIAGYAAPEALKGYADQGGALAETEEIDFEALEARRGQPGMQVLDVRSRDEYRAGHIPGALHIAHMRLRDHIDDLPTGKTLLVHCGGGVRASSAASLVERYGRHVQFVNDRFSNWSQAHPEEVER